MDSVSRTDISKKTNKTNRQTNQLHSKAKTEK